MRATTIFGFYTSLALLTLLSASACDTSKKQSKAPKQVIGNCIPNPQDSAYCKDEGKDDPNCDPLCFAEEQQNWINSLVTDAELLPYQKAVTYVGDPDRGLAYVKGFETELFNASNRLDESNKRIIARIREVRAFTAEQANANRAFARENGLTILDGKPMPYPEEKTCIRRCAANVWGGKFCGYARAPYISVLDTTLQRKCELELRMKEVELERIKKEYIQKNFIDFIENITDAEARATLLRPLSSFQNGVGAFMDAIFNNRFGGYKEGGGGRYVCAEDPADPTTTGHCIPEMVHQQEIREAQRDEQFFYCDSSAFRSYPYEEGDDGYDNCIQLADANRIVSSPAAPIQPPTPCAANSALTTHNADSPNGCRADQVPNSTLERPPVRPEESEVSQ